MMLSSSWIARTSSLILRWSIRIRATPCGESDSSRSRSCSTSNVGPSGSCSRCLMSLISSDLAGPPVGSAYNGAEFFLSTARHRFFLPNTYFARKPSSRRFFVSEKTRRSSDIFCTFAKLLISRRARFSLHCVYESELRDVPNSLDASAFPDHLQILPQFDPAAVWQETAEIYAWVNHAIAADNRAGIDHRIAADLGSVADDCAEFS